MDKQQVIKPSSLIEGELEKINLYTKRYLTENEIYVFSVVLCDNEVNRDFEQFTVEALKKLSELYIGKTIILNNNSTTRIINCEVKKIDGRKNSIGEDFYQLVGRAFILMTTDNKNIIKSIENGIINKISIGCAVSKTMCSICGDDINLCPHKKGEYYTNISIHKEKLCYGKLIEPYDAYEVAFVATPKTLDDRKQGVLNMTNNKNNEKFKTVKNKSKEENVDYVDIFGAKLDVDILNHAINAYEKKFNCSPYLIMSNATLESFERLTITNIFDDCGDYNDCDNCPHDAECPNEDFVNIEYDYKTNIPYADYHGLKILVDNNLAFGIVKVR